MLLLLAVVPLDVILSGANVLSVLAQTVSLVSLFQPFFVNTCTYININLCFESSLGAIGFEHGLSWMQSSSSVEEF